MLLSPKTVVLTLLFGSHLLSSFPSQLQVYNLALTVSTNSSLAHIEPLPPDCLRYISILLIFHCCFVSLLLYHSWLRKSRRRISYPALVPCSLAGFYFGVNCLRQPITLPHRVFITWMYQIYLLVSAVSTNYHLLTESLHRLNVPRLYFHWTFHHRLISCIILDQATVSIFECADAAASEELCQDKPHLLHQVVPISYEKEISMLQVFWRTLLWCQAYPPRIHKWCQTDYITWSMSETCTPIEDSFWCPWRIISDTSDNQLCSKKSHYFFLIIKVVTVCLWKSLNCGNSLYTSQRR